MGVRRIVGLLGVIIMALMLLAMFIIGQHLASEQIYTVGEVRAGLQRHPELWAGRTVLVRGGVNQQTRYPQCAARCLPADQLPELHGAAGSGNLPLWEDCRPR